MMMQSNVPTHHLGCKPKSGGDITLIAFTQADIRQAMVENAFRLGFTYWLQGDILEINAKTDKQGFDLLTAKVRGIKHHRYDVSIKISLDDQGQVQFEGCCSCLEGIHCAHMAAVLFYVLNNKSNLLYSQSFSNKVADIAPSRKTSHNTNHAHQRPLTADPQSYLDSSLKGWLTRLTQAVLETTLPNTYPEHIKQRILYLFDLKKKGEKQSLQLEVVLARQLRNGHYGKTYYLRSTTADYVLPIDKSLLTTLEPFKINRPYQLTYQLQNLTHDTLKQILATGRCHWQDKDQPSLTLGPSRTARPVWEVNEEGIQYLLYKVTEGADVILPLSPPWYIDTQSNLCGPLETGLPCHLASTLLEAPPIKPLQAEIVGHQLAKYLPYIPQPHCFQQTYHQGIKPTIHLYLFNQAFSVVRQHRWEHYSDNLEISIAHLAFAYESRIVNAYAQTLPVLNVFDEKENKLIQIERDLQLEQSAKNFLTTTGFKLLTEHHWYHHIEPAEEHQKMLFLAPDTDPYSIEQTLLNFSLDEIPKLRAMGWQVEMAPNYSFRVIEPEFIEEWYAKIDEHSGVNWFGLELGIRVEGQTINLLPLLVQLLREMAQAHQLSKLTQLPEDTLLKLRLEDGRILPIPVSRVRNILQVLLELVDKNPLDQQDQLRLGRVRAAQLPELEAAIGLPLQWWGGEKLRELGRKLNYVNTITAITIPPQFKTTLRGYQQEGLNWLQFLREYGLAGILADDMGLGKTIQTLAHILTEKTQGRLTQPALVITPTSLVLNWQREAQRFAPDLKVLALQGPHRQKEFEQIANADLILTTYALLHRDREILLSHQYHLLILDEAQNIKNPRAQITQIVYQIRTNHRLCLTGTPLENNLRELWSLFHFLIPGLLGEYHHFHRVFRTPIEKEGDSTRRTILSQRIKPFLLRRTKEIVIQELPPKNEIIRLVELESEQRDLYETIRLSLHEKVCKEVAEKGMARSQIIILDALLKLRQLCCDPRLLKLESVQSVHQSAKLRLLMDLVPEMIAEGRKILLFSQFTTMLDLIATEFKKYKLAYVKLTGQTQNRSQVIDCFQSGEVPIFLISLKAGGTGLNLTAADTVIHYDPWWNPAVEMQATDRAHRIGQDKPVFVYKLLTAGTVEEKIQELQLRKQQLIDAIFSDNNHSKIQLSPEDLDRLFQPVDNHFLR
ncbi:MAG: DEAD/DEAH box helicase [Thioploca sp.]|nr:DEAD/DEAH box helicase [Thioploca sp.]